MRLLDYSIFTGFFQLLLDTNQATLSPWTSSLGEEVSLPQPCQCLKTALVGKEVCTRFSWGYKTLCSSLLMCLLHIALQNGNSTSLHNILLMPA